MFALLFVEDTVGNFVVSVDNVVGPNVSDKEVIPSSCCSALVNANIVFQLVTPSVGAGTKPGTFLYVEFTHSCEI